MEERAQIILWGAEGQTNLEIAQRLRTRVARICKWRTRFVKVGLQDLVDEARSGQPGKYTAETERTLLRKLDDPPPKGYVQWNGRLLWERIGIPDYQVWAVLHNHGPTHIDSVSHLSRDPNAPPVDKIPLENCITPATCLDVSDIPQKTQFGRKKIESELKRWNLDIRKGDTILFYTGQYDRYYGKPEYMTDYPGLDREGTEFIIDQGCVNFGVDSASPDMWYDKTYPCHSVCAERWVTHIENLCNLDKLLGKRFTFIGLPLKIRNGTGSPIRAVAILEE